MKHLVHIKEASRVTDPWMNGDDDIKKDILTHEKHIIDRLMRDIKENPLLYCYLTDESKRSRFGDIYVIMKTGDADDEDLLDALKETSEKLTEAGVKNGVTLFRYPVRGKNIETIPWDKFKATALDKDIERATITIHYTNRYYDKGRRPRKK